jgi:hypothetical protein
MLFSLSKLQKTVEQKIQEEKPTHLGIVLQLLHRLSPQRIQRRRHIRRQSWETRGEIRVGASLERMCESGVEDVVECCGSVAWWRRSRGGCGAGGHARAYVGSGRKGGLRHSLFEFGDAK